MRYALTESLYSERLFHSVLTIPIFTARFQHACKKLLFYSKNSSSGHCKFLAMRAYTLLKILQ